MIERLARMTYKHARRAVVIIVGFTVLLVGIVMLVLPGPGIVGIGMGLAILATELVWARRFLKRVKKSIGIKEKTPGQPVSESTIKHSNPTDTPFANG